MFDYLPLADLVLRDMPQGGVEQRAVPAGVMSMRELPVASVQQVEGTNVLKLHTGGYLYLHSQGRLITRPRFS